MKLKKRKNNFEVIILQSINFRIFNNFREKETKISAYNLITNNEIDIKFYFHFKSLGLLLKKNIKILGSIGELEIKNVKHYDGDCGIVE